MNSTKENPQVFNKYLADKTKLGCIIPVLATALGNLRCLHLTPFEGSFQKKREPNGKWCLIVDLSSPKGGSGNGT